MTKPRFVEDEEGFAHLWRDAQRRRGTHFGLWMRRPKAKEAFMRAIAAAIVAIAVLAVGGLTSHHGVRNGGVTRTGESADRYQVSGTQRARGPAWWPPYPCGSEKWNSGKS